MEKKIIEADRVYQITTPFNDFDILLRRGIKEGFKYLIVFYNVHDYDKYQIRIFIDHYYTKPIEKEEGFKLIYGDIMPKYLVDKYLSSRYILGYGTGTKSRESWLEGNKVSKICFSNSPEKYYKIPITYDCNLISKALKYYSDDRYLDGYVIRRSCDQTSAGIFNLNSYQPRNSIVTVMFLYEHSNIILQRLLGSDNTIIELIKQIKQQELSIIDKTKDIMRKLIDKF